MSDNMLPMTRVMVVDDSAAMRAVLCSLLRQEGYRVVGELADGNSLMSAIQRSQPEIICLDQHMPGSDGLSLLREVRAANPEIAVIMITASNDLATRQTAVGAGVAGFLAKPFSPAQILGELKQVDHARKLLLQTAQARGAAVAATGGLRAVLADDSSTMRMLLCAILQDMGLTVVAQASDGLEAVDMVKQHLPEIVCLDVEMPKLGGLEALGRIHNAHPDVRIVMVTSDAARDTVRQAISAGASGYILKPYEAEQVQSTLRRILSVGKR